MIYSLQDKSNVKNQKGISNKIADVRLSKGYTIRKKENQIKIKNKFAFLKKIATMDTRNKAKDKTIQAYFLSSKGSYKAVPPRQSILRVLCLVYK